ncbi:MAG: hypothetical protein AAGG46_05890, partial [Planctomycetota bacterium]
FVPKWITTMAKHADAETGPRLQPWAGNLPIVVLKVVAVVLGLLSILHLGFALYSIAQTDFSQLYGVGGSGWFWVLQSTSALSTPAIEFLGAGMLFVLCEIALRLNKR